jgi:hypothetical protein
MTMAVSQARWTSGITPVDDPASMSTLVGLRDVRIGDVRIGDVRIGDVRYR